MPAIDGQRLSAILATCQIELPTHLYCQPRLPLPAMNGTASQGNGDDLQSTSGTASNHMVPTNGYSWGDAVLVPQPFPARRWLAGTRYLLMPES